MRVCFERCPPREVLDALGNTDRWQLYRQMVRSRISKVVRNAFPRFSQALGDEAIQSEIETWLHETPPTSRYFREAPSEFFQHLTRAMPGGPTPLSATQELAMFEHSRWTRRFCLPQDAPEASELDFSRPPLLNPTAALHEFGHPVHQADARVESLSSSPTWLCIYRDFKEHRVQTRVLNPTAYALLQRWSQPDKTLTETIEDAQADLGFAIDTSFLERLGELLASFLDDGLLLGSRPQ